MLANIIIAIIGMTVMLHGLFDVWSDSLIGIGIAGISFVTFMGYLMHGEDERLAGQDTAAPGADMNDQVPSLPTECPPVPSDTSK